MHVCYENHKVDLVFTETTFTIIHVDIYRKVGTGSYTPGKIYNTYLPVCEKDRSLLLGTCRKQDIFHCTSMHPVGNNGPILTLEGILHVLCAEQCKPVLKSCAYEIPSSVLGLPFFKEYFYK